MENNSQSVMMLLALVFFALLMLNGAVCFVIFTLRMISDKREKVRNQMQLRWRLAMVRLFSSSSPDPALLDMARSAEREEALVIGELAGKIAKKMGGEARISVSSQLEETGLLEYIKEELYRKAPWRRAWAAVVLGNLGKPESAQILEPLLRDPNFHVRMTALRGLTEIGTPECGKMVKEAMESRLVPFGASLEALSNLGDVGAGVFISVCDSSDPEIRLLSYRGISSVPSSTAQAFSLNEMLERKAMEEARPELRAEAMRALSLIDQKRAAKHASGILLSDPSSKVRKECARAIKRFSHREDLPVLCEALKDDDIIVAIEVAEAISDMITDGKIDRLEVDEIESRGVLSHVLSRREAAVCPTY